jgi:hypothetical protein
MVLPDKVQRERLANRSERIWQIHLANSDPNVSLPAMLELMQFVGGFEEIVEKVRRCCPHRPCYIRFCPRCAIPDRDRVAATRRETEQARSESRSHNPRIRGRQSVQPFLRFPQHQVFFVTINLENGLILF